MTRKDPLLALRLAIHGWAFADLPGQLARLRQAEEELKALPAKHKHEGNRLLTPLRDAVREQSE